MMGATTSCSDCRTESQFTTTKAAADFGTLRPRPGFDSTEFLWGSRLWTSTTMGISTFISPGSPNGEFNFTAAAPQTANSLWRNNGDGTFTDWTVQSGLGGDGRPAIAALASDLNNDRAVDLVLTGWRESAAVFTNPREGPFRQSEPWDSKFPAN